MKSHIYHNTFVTIHNFLILLIEIKNFKITSFTPYLYLEVTNFLEAVFSPEFITCYMSHKVKAAVH